MPPFWSRGKHIDDVTDRVLHYPSGFSGNWSSGAITVESDRTSGTNTIPCSGTGVFTEDHGYHSGRSDVFSAGCQIDGRARHERLDDEIEFEGGEYGTMHDVLAPFDPHAHEADPAEEAARNLDWQAFLAVHSQRHRLAILVLIDGGTMREAGLRCGLRDSAALNLRRRIAADLIEFFGEEEIRRLLNGRMPAWEAGLQASRHRHLCHSSLVNGREVGRSEGQDGSL